MADAKYDVPLEDGAVALRNLTSVRHDVPSLTLVTLTGDKRFSYIVVLSTLSFLQMLLSEWL